MALSVGTKAPDFTLSSKQVGWIEKVTLSEKRRQGRSWSFSSHGLHRRLHRKNCAA